MENEMAWKKFLIWIKYNVMSSMCNTRERKQDATFTLKWEQQNDYTFQNWQKIVRNF